MVEPDQIDPLRFCKLAQTWEVDSNLSKFPRLAHEFTQGQLFCRVAGRMDRQGGCVLHLEIRGDVDLTCQRCLGGLTHQVAIERDVYLARNDAELEDEVLLGLPLTPMHAPGVCVIPPGIA
jgi:DUF177 domain-containing protein